MKPKTSAWLITGIPGAGKSTVARALADRLPRSAHIEGDLVGAMIRSGLVGPGDPPYEESQRQLALSISNQAMLAHAFAEAGFTPIIDFVIAGLDRVGAYYERVRDLTVRLVVLEPGREVASQRDRDRAEKTIGDRYAHLGDAMRAEFPHIGLWIDTAGLTVEQTVDAILAGEEAAILRSGDLPGTP